MSGANAIEIICWLLLVVGIIMPIFVYIIEKKQIGGVGIGTMLSVGVVIYSIINLTAYLINPKYSPAFYHYIGNLNPADIFKILMAPVIFLVTLTLFIAILPSYHKVKEKKLKPINGKKVKKLITIGIILFISSMLLFLYRNIIFFGSPLGSLNAVYDGVFARPRAGFASNYASLLNWSMMIISLTIFWQVQAKKWNVILSFIPIAFGIVFAILEGNRLPLVTAIFIWIGWFSFRKKITFKMLILVLLILTFVALLANARYQRGEQGAIKRASTIFNLEYFRPFWDSDPVGPTVVLSSEVLKIKNWREISFGLGYIQSIGSVIPSFIWPNRPMSPTDQFAQQFEEQNMDMQYAPGTGYAYSAIAEAYVNFWYFGCALLAIVMANIVNFFNRICSTDNPGINRLFVSFALFLAIWPIPRSFFAELMSPLTLISIIIYWFVLYTIMPERFAVSIFNKNQKKEINADY